jgi:hypothetical protein
MPGATTTPPCRLPQTRHYLEKGGFSGSIGAQPMRHGRPVVRRQVFKRQIPTKSEGDTGNLWPGAQKRGFSVAARRSQGPNAKSFQQLQGLGIGGGIQAPSDR